MAATQNKPFHWLRQISPALLRINHIPQYGYAPAFPWEEFFTKVSDHFQLSEINYELPSFRFLSQDQLPALFDEDMVYFNITLSSLPESFKWVISKAHLKQMMSLLLKVDINKAREIDESFFEGFKTFLAYELSFIYSQIGFDKKLDPKIKIEKEVEHADYLCQDLFLQLKDCSLASHLLFSNEFLSSWRQKFLEKKSPMPESLSQTTLPVQLIGGSISLMSSQWRQVSYGDLLILDQCTVDPQNKAGQVLLAIDQIPFFNAQLEGDKIQILNKDVFHEAPPPMIKKNEPEEDDDEDLFDEDTDFEDLDFDDFDEDFDEEDESNDEDISEEEESEEKEQEDEIDEDKASQDSTDQQSEPIEKPVSSAKSPIQKVDDLPLNISVEIARLEMTIQKLSDLQPGNLLELDNSLENEVDLVVNGRRIARGELLRIGDHLGVRILEIN